MDRSHTIVHERSVTHIRDDTNNTVMCGVQGFHFWRREESIRGNGQFYPRVGMFRKPLQGSLHPLETTTHQGTPARQPTLPDTSRTSRFKVHERHVFILLGLAETVTQGTAAIYCGTRLRVHGLPAMQVSQRSVLHGGGNQRSIDDIGTTDINRSLVLRLFGQLTALPRHEKMGHQQVHPLRVAILVGQPCPVIPQENPQLLVGILCTHVAFGPLPVRVRGK